MNYVVVAKEGDPAVRPARARLIWAANTAQATASLGLQCILAGGIDAFTYRIENVAGKFSAYRAISALYGVEGQFELALLHRNSKAAGWTADGDFARYVLPNAAVVHTRDPQIALVCARHNVAYILENHDEDYQKKFTRWDELKLGSPLCLAIVAITDAVKQQLIELGMPEQKIVVLDSGVNEATALRRPGRPRSGARRCWTTATEIWLSIPGVCRPSGESRPSSDPPASCRNAFLCSPAAIAAISMPAAA